MNELINAESNFTYFIIALDFGGFRVSSCDHVTVSPLSLSSRHSPISEGKSRDYYNYTCILRSDEVEKNVNGK